MKRNEITKSESEVENLLKAVEDEMLLKLSLDSHISANAPNYLRSDLDHRFRSLKNPKPSSSKLPETSVPSSSSADPDLDAVLGADLAARFSALRASLPANSTAAMPNLGGDWDEDDEEEEDEDEQVERLIQWAKDAARLDPTPSSDDELDDEINSV